MKIKKEDFDIGNLDYLLEQVDENIYENTNIKKLKNYLLSVILNFYLIQIKR